MNRLRRISIVLSTYFLFSASCAFAACTQISAGVWQTADNTHTAVNECIAAASAGNTIFVVAGAGTATWPANAVTIPTSKQPLTIIGPGRGELTINLAGNYVFVIQAYNGSIKSPGTSISGFTFKNKDTQYTPIYINGSGWRIHNNEFINEPRGANSILVQNNSSSYVGLHGLVDNNIFKNGKVLVNGHLGRTNVNTAWSEAGAIGASTAVYIEDNMFSSYSSASELGLCVDANRGGMYVFRYNTVDRTTNLAHGLQEDTERGTRSYEIYGNNYATDKWYFNAINTKAGTGMIFINDLSEGSYYSPILFHQERSYRSIGVARYCDGNSMWDKNTSEQTGWPCRDQIGTYQDAELWKTWSVTGCSDNGEGKIRLLATGHDLEPTDQAYVRVVVGCNPDIIGLHDILAIDGNNIDIDLPYVSALTKNGIVYGHPPNQRLAPVYLWSNFDGSGLIQPTVPTPHDTHIKANRDYYTHDTTNCPAGGEACMAGVGCGTIANRPTNCSTGVAYWATDQSCTNINKLVGASTLIGGTRSPALFITGKLYKCVAENKWSSDNDGITYKPYYYPHPLSLVLPPKNLTIKR